MRPESQRNPSLLSTFDGIFYCLMVGCGETYLVAFALKNGVSEVEAALLGIVPVIIGSILQLLTYRVAASVGSLRRWVVSLAIIQAVSIGVAALPILPRLAPHTFPILMIVASIYWTASLAAGPPWNAWIGELIPAEKQHHFFLRRNIALQAATIVALFGSGWFLEIASDPNYGTRFGALFLLAAMFRTMSAYFLSRQPDAKQAIERPMKLADTVNWLQRRHIKYAFIYTLCLNTAVYTSAPYFVPFMLSELNLSFMNFTILIAVAFAARTLVGPVLRGIVMRQGVQAMFLTGFFMTIPLPWYWTLTDSFLWLVAFQILSGLAWGAHEMGLTLFLMESISHSERSRLLSLNNFAASIGMLIGVTLGLVMLGDDDLLAEDYHFIFNFSSVARFIPIVFIFGFIRAIKPMPIRMRILGVRPGGFGFLRPIIQRRHRDKAD